MPEEIKSNTCEFGTELDVERITGRSRQTLQKDRYFGRGFPFYRVGRQVIYDLNEVRRLIRAGRIEGQTGTHRGQVREVPDVDAYLRDIEAVRAG